MFLIAEEKKPDFPRIKDEVQTMVKNAGGTWTGDEYTFDRKLAYEIKHHWRGTYYVGRFTLPTRDEQDENEDKVDVIADVTRQLNLNKEILRYIIVSAEDLPPLAETEKLFLKREKEKKKHIKETGEKIDAKLEKALNI